MIRYHVQLIFLFIFWITSASRNSFPVTNQKPRIYEQRFPEEIEASIIFDRISFIDNQIKFLKVEKDTKIRELMHNLEVDLQSIDYIINDLEQKNEKDYLSLNDKFQEAEREHKIKVKILNDERNAEVEKILKNHLLRADVKELKIELFNEYYEDLIFKLNSQIKIEENEFKKDKDDLKWDLIKKYEKLSNFKNDIKSKNFDEQENIRKKFKNEIDKLVEEKIRLKDYIDHLIQVLKTKYSLNL